jgi:hypothetical protein
VDNARHSTREAVESWRPRQHAFDPPARERLEPPECRATGHLCDADRNQPRALCLDLAIDDAPKDEEVWLTRNVV